ncbi:C-X-C chemokine receptor type 2 [Takifugu flavidus]|uniref:C-X-C chemokine receptor type 2 n=2 Tax=Takifugu flavidus TaxID=433684 RepID=A0A5C6PM88_9TELE|nr:C-X-C chemokine receptor type 2 [Takifugu flavidus]
MASWAEKEEKREAHWLGDGLHTREMKLQFLLVTALSCLRPSSPQDGAWQPPMTPVFNFEGLLEGLENSSYDLYDDSSVPCNLTVPGFNNLGLAITYVFVFVLSTVGNSVVICVVCCMAKRRSSTDIYLTHLALADLLFGFTVLFWGLDIHYGWIFGNGMCKFLSGLQEASEYSSVFLLACISVDRHLAIVKATRVKSPRRPVVTVTCAAVWLVAMLLALPTVIQRRHMSTEDLDHDICYEDTDENTDRLIVVMGVIHQVLGFFLPLGIMTVCYSSTLVTLYHRHNRQKQKAIRVILAVVFAFIVCWLPYHVVLLIKLLISSSLVQERLCETRYSLEAAYRVTKVLAFVHCAVNPVLYAFIGVKFRNRLLTVCHKQGLISSTLLATFKKGSVSSVGSTRSRNSSVTL